MLTEQHSRPRPAKSVAPAQVFRWNNHLDTARWPREHSYTLPCPAGSCWCPSSLTQVCSPCTDTSEEQGEPSARGKQSSVCFAVRVKQMSLSSAGCVTLLTVVSQWNPTPLYCGFHPPFYLTASHMTEGRYILHSILTLARCGLLAIVYYTYNHAWPKYC